MGINAFAISKHKIRKATSLPARRETLVVSGFPAPTMARIGKPQHSAQQHSSGNGTRQVPSQQREKINYGKHFTFSPPNTFPRWCRPLISNRFRNRDETDTKAPPRPPRSTWESMLLPYRNTKSGKQLLCLPGGRHWLSPGSRPQQWRGSGNPSTLLSNTAAEMEPDRYPPSKGRKSIMANTSPFRLQTLSRDGAAPSSATDSATVMKRIQRLHQGRHDPHGNQCFCHIETQNQESNFFACQAGDIGCLRVPGPNNGADRETPALCSATQQRKWNQTGILPPPNKGRKSIMANTSPFRLQTLSRDGAAPSSATDSATVIMACNCEVPAP